MKGAFLDTKPQDGSFSSFYNFPSCVPSTKVSGSSGGRGTANSVVGNVSTPTFGPRVPMSAVFHPTPLCSSRGDRNDLAFLCNLALASCLCSDIFYGHFLFPPKA